MTFIDLPVRKAQAIVQNYKKLLTQFYAMKLPKSFPGLANLAGYLLLQQADDELFNWVLLNQAAIELNGQGMRAIEAKKRGLVRYEIGKLLDPTMQSYRMEEGQL